MRASTIVTTLLLIVAPSVHAERAPETLTLPAAIDLALTAHPSIGIAEARLTVADQATKEARADRWPRISVSGTVTQYEEPMVVTPIHGFGFDLFPEFDDTLVQNALNVDLLLWSGGATSSRIEAAEATAHAAVDARELVRHQLITRTAAIYLAVLSHTAQLEGHDARLRALESEVARVTQLLEVGRAAEVDRLRVEAAIAAAQAERDAVFARLDAARRELSRLIGRTDLPGTYADVTLDEHFSIDRTDLADLAIEANPSVASARDAVNERRAAIALARSTYFPQVRATGSWLQFGDDSLSFDNEWNIGIRVRIPIWDGGATAARVGQARAALRIAEEQVVLEEHRVLDQVDSILATIEQAEANVQSLETAVERFEEVARVERLRLESGAGTQADYLRAEADLLQARAGLAAATYQRILARIELARITGQLDPEWIRTTLRSAS